MFSKQWSNFTRKSSTTFNYDSICGPGRESDFDPEGTILHDKVFTKECRRFHPDLEAVGLQHRPGIGPVRIGDLDRAGRRRAGARS